MCAISGLGAFIILNDHGPAHSSDLVTVLLLNQLIYKSLLLRNLCLQNVHFSFQLQVLVFQVISMHFLPECVIEQFLSVKSSIFWSYSAQVTHIYQAWRDQRRYSSQQQSLSLSHCYCRILVRIGCLEWFLAHSELKHLISSIASVWSAFETDVGLDICATHIRRIHSLLLGIRLSWEKSIDLVLNVNGLLVYVPIILWCWVIDLLQRIHHLRSHWPW